MLGRSITGKAVFIGIVQCAVFAVKNTKKKKKGKGGQTFFTWKEMEIAIS